MFSRRSTGRLAASLRGRVASTTMAYLAVGVEYGLIQDHGGVTKAHPIKLRNAKAFAFASGPGGFSNAARIGSSKKFARIGSSRISRASAAGKSITGMTIVSGSKGTPGTINHPGSRIPATNYSWKAYLASRDLIRQQISDAMLGRGVYAR